MVEPTVTIINDSRIGIYVRNGILCELLVCGTYGFVYIRKCILEKIIINKQK